MNEVYNKLLEPLYRPHLIVACLLGPLPTQYRCRYLLATMKVQIWGCRGSIPRPNPDMARYGGNTPCIEVVASGAGGDGHRIIFDLGSGAFDLGQKILNEMFQQKKRLADMEKERAGKEGCGELSTSVGSPAEQQQSTFGGSILITHTHWDHIQGNCYDRVFQFAQSNPALDLPHFLLLFISAGLPFFVPLYLPQFDWMIYGPRGIAKTLQETLSGQMQHDYFPVRMGDMGSRIKYQGLCEDVRKGFWLGDEGAPTSIKVTSKYLNHSVLTLGYKLEEFARIPEPDKCSNGDKFSNGRALANRGVSVAYITDHEPFDHSLAKGGFVDSAINTKTPRLSADHSHAQFFRGVDILFHDSQYLYSEYSPTSGAMSKEYWGHSTVEYVVEVAFYANVKKLLLFHHDPQRNDDQMDDLVKYAQKKAEELEKQFGDHKASFGIGPRVPMEVIGSKEGDIYELDPFVFTRDNHIDYRHHHEKKSSDIDSVSTAGSSFANANFDNQIVLLGFCRTDPKSICNVLQSSENSFDVSVVQESIDILQFAKSKKPSVIILDEILIGSTAFEVCDEIRDMGAWGEYVSLIIIAAPTVDAFDSQEESSVLTETKEKLILERLNVGEYIQGPFSPSYLLTRIQVSLLRMPLRWRRAPFSSRESLRLLTLQNTGLLDSDPEERFDRITRLCSAMFNAPISAVSLVDNDRQWFKSIVGLPGVTETPRDSAFCAHTILGDDIMVVPDALQDERFADNPLVDGEPNIRFYAGCPIRISSSNNSEEKFPIGALCIIDYKPRDLCEAELRSLRDFGAMLECEIANFRNEKIDR